MSFVQNLTPAQATDLFLLVNLEAHWENLRAYRPTLGKTYTIAELHQKQKAYEAFSARLIAYNKVYKPTHVSEQLLNSARRLGPWCGKMHDLLVRVQTDNKAHFPVHLIEKAYLWTDRIAETLQKDRIVRPAVSEDFREAIRQLQDLTQWCQNLLPLKLAG